jgi:Pyruvate/2-oxoacid:ferredoxin oxidoreductase delta subunit
MMRPLQTRLSMKALDNYTQVKNHRIIQANTGVQYQMNETTQKNMTLYEQLAAGIGFGNSKLVPKLFEAIADEDEARFMLAASPPATIEEIAEKSGIPLEQAKEMIDPLFKKGLIFKSKKPDATRYYRVRSFVQFHDATVLTPGISQEYLDLWKEFEEKELPVYHNIAKDYDFRQGMRVVPVNVTIESSPQVLAFDDVTKMIEEARRIAVTNCSCRTIHGKTDVPLEVCMQIDKAADYAVERGTGRELTKQEAIDMLRMCEEEGLVHCVDNKRALGHIICNCDNEVCGNWGSDRDYVKKFTAPSRFRAIVEAELCIACEECQNRCFFDAVTMDVPDGTAIIDITKCMGCGICIPTCPGEAITLKEARPEDFIPE